MSDINQAQNLLRAAQRDLKALAGMSDANVFADEIFGFHVQQAVEKLLKAWLAALGTMYPLTHNLDILFQLLEDLDFDVADYRELSDFAPFAVRLRYEDIDSEEDPVERSPILAQVQLLFNQVETVINDTI
ncbi:MAG: HEPN domain-containing protein [Phormidesmis sp.]